MATVRVIEANPELAIGNEAIIAKRKRKVAAYARVSTEQEEQEGSYEAQVDYYTQYIKSNPEWEFVEVYADKGISGTGTKKREGFNRMMNDAKNGKIDLILTKSISRFARNTTDSLNAIRELKEFNVDIYFEKESIHSLDSKGELLITIMSSIAQEESRSISENVIWGKRKRMAEGIVSFAWDYILGYRKGENGLPEIVEEEAKIIRRVFRMYLEGYSTHVIAETLTNEGILTSTGRNKWSSSGVQSILKNEKYKGDALLQKTFTVDFLSKKVKKNRGELPQYYVENSHPAIIPRETFDLVQKELNSRPKGYYTSISPMNGNVICGCCGGKYSRRTWHSNSKYKYQTWQCRNRYAPDTECRNADVRETNIEKAFVIAVNKIISNKEDIINQMESLLLELLETSSYEDRLEEAIAERNEAVDSLNSYIDANVRILNNEQTFLDEVDRLRAEYEKCRLKVQKCQDKLSEMSLRRDKITSFISNLERSNLISEYSPLSWRMLAENVTINADHSFTFLFRNGTKVTIEQKAYSK